MGKDSTMPLSIKKHIDETVCLKLMDWGYDDVKKYLRESATKFRQSIVDRLNIGEMERSGNFNEEGISKIENYQTGYYAYYIFYAEKRIADLCEIEKKYNFGFTPHKNFTLLLFKEKLNTPKPITAIVPYKKIATISKDGIKKDPLFKAMTSTQEPFKSQIKERISPKKELKFKSKFDLGLMGLA